MLAVAFVAPSLSMVYIIQATSTTFQIVTYMLVWQNIVEIEDHKDTLDQILLWWFPFLLVDTGFFILIQKRELAQFFLY